MGHAGAIVTAGKGTVEDKVAALEGAGALVADRPSEVGELLQSVLTKVG
jgi:succinyl-CoA synthetase alpha subunit